MQLNYQKAFLQNTIVKNAFIQNTIIMRQINLIVIHCSATKENHPFTLQSLEASHRKRGFNGIGYHYYIRQSGEVINTRPLSRIGAHAKGYNRNSIGICYEGGLDKNGKPKDTRTRAQREALRQLVNELLAHFPGCKVCGHRDLSPDLNRNGKIEPREWTKLCPCFDVASDIVKLVKPR